MINRFHCCVLIATGALLLSADASAQRSGQLICYYDAEGVFTCGQSVPPEDARFDRDIRNQQGIVIRREQGEITAEEQAVIDEQARIEAERQRAIEEQQAYDQMLLDVYLSDKDIANLRDRRLEVMDSRIRVTEILLENRRKQLENLMGDAQRFAPYSDNEDAPPIPENLAVDIERAQGSIELREKTLREIEEDQEQIRRDFQRDIDRFRELKGLPPIDPSA